jgi:hypothetical protein
MSIIPLHLQRRFEQRWAARFAPRVVSATPKSIVLRGTDQNPAFSKGKARRVATKPIGAGAS